MVYVYARVIIMTQCSTINVATTLGKKISRKDFAKIREIKFPRKFFKTPSREIKFPRNFLINIFNAFNIFPNYLCLVRG